MGLRAELIAGFDSDKRTMGRTASPSSATLPRTKVGRSSTVFTAHFEGPFIDCVTYVGLTFNSAPQTGFGRYGTYLGNAGVQSLSSCTFLRPPWDPPVVLSGPLLFCSLSRRWSDPNSRLASRTIDTTYVATSVRECVYAKLYTVRAFCDRETRLIFITAYTVLKAGEDSTGFYANEYPTTGYNVRSYSPVCHAGSHGVF